MAKLKIVKVGDDVLRKRCRPVEEITPKIHRLLDDMAETMRAAQGVGLAAPQVGILRRIVVVEVEEGNLIELIKQDEMFKPVWDHIDDVLDAKNYIGRAPLQTVEFIQSEIDPILQQHADLLGDKGDVRI